MKIKTEYTVCYGPGPDFIDGSINDINVVDVLQAHQTKKSFIVTPKFRAVFQGTVFVPE
jgi:hypothetical protein